YSFALPPPSHTLSFSLRSHAASSSLRAVLSFPTRRSSDLGSRGLAGHPVVAQHDIRPFHRQLADRLGTVQRAGFQVYDAHLYPRDRKSTRLNSSHEWISYAVFCLKKKKKKSHTPK